MRLIDGTNLVAQSGILRHEYLNFNAFNLARQARKRLTLQGFFPLWRPVLASRMLEMNFGIIGLPLPRYP